MSQTSTLSRLDQMIATAERQHVGPRLYLLSAHQRSIWDRHQHEQRQTIEKYETEHGSGSYYEAVLDGNDPCADQQLPCTIKKLLGMGREPTSIPASMSLDDIRQLYENLAHPE